MSAVPAMEVVLKYAQTPLEATRVPARLVIPAAVYAQVGIDSRLHQIFMHISKDTNECIAINGGCSQWCTNTNGSFVCSCETGYSLDTNNLTCGGKL